MTERKNDPAQGAPEQCARCGRDFPHMPDEGNYCCCPRAYRQARQAAPEAPRETVGASLTDERCATCGGRLIGLIKNACPHCRGAARLQQPKNCTSLFCPSGGDGPHTIIDALGAAATQAGVVRALAAPEAPDDGELEAWRATADDLLRCVSDNAGLTRRAAHLLQNAYLFATSLAASEAEAVKVETVAGHLERCMAKINGESQFQSAAWINGARALERLLREEGASL